MGSMVFKILEILFLVLCIDYVGFASAFTFNRDNLIDYSNELLLDEGLLSMQNSWMGDPTLVATVNSSLIKRRSLISDDVLTVSNRDLIIVRNGVGSSLIYNRIQKPYMASEKNMNLVGLYSMGAMRQEGVNIVSGMDANFCMEQGQIMQKAFPPNLPANPIPIGDALPFVLCAVGGYVYMIWISKVIK